MCLKSNKEEFEQYIRQLYTFNIAFSISSPSKENTSSSQPYFKSFQILLTYNRTKIYRVIHNPKYKTIRGWYIKIQNLESQHLIQKITLIYCVTKCMVFQDSKYHRCEHVKKCLFWRVMSFFWFHKHEQKTCLHKM